MRVRLANPVTAWWRSPWALVPAALVGGLAIGTGILRAAGPSCPALVPEGGVVLGVRYIERMRGGATADEQVPMVIMLHTLTGRPENYKDGMNGIGKARLILPEGGYAMSTGRSWFPRGLKATVDAGNAPAEMDAWRAAGERLAAFIETMAHCRPTVGKPIITGSSQGGEMALLLANQHRRLVHGAVAMNSDLPSPLWEKRMAPVFMGNGTGDTTVPYAWAKAHAEAAIARGEPVTFESFGSSTHALTTAQGKAWIAAVRSMVAQAS